jgi:oxygen-dependent protoporphyrinogen oxidase
MPSVVIVGAGISGLATATFLRERGVDCTVFDAAPEAGGNVRTDRIDGRVLDRAATGWLDSEPAMGRLIDLLDLTDQVIPASHRSATRWIYADERMHLVPMSPGALLRSRLIPWWSKLRLLAEPFLRRGKSGEETVYAFVTRRLGRAFADRLVGPMVAGIYAAHPAQLSLRAAFPRMHAMEQEHRSLFLALRAAKRAGKAGGPAGPAGHLQTLRGGAGTLTEVMAKKLGEDLQCGIEVTSVRPRADAWEVHTPQGTTEADAVVLACPAPAQATLVRGLDPDLAGTLDAIPYAPVSVVITAWPAGSWDRSPEGFGVLVAPGEDVGVLGTLYTSGVFPSQAPEGEVLLRTMVGGAVDPDAARLPHQNLLDRVTSAHRRFFGSQRADPLMVQVYRHPQGIPQYTLGHPARVASVRAAQAKLPGLFFTGNHLDGIGVKDCAAAAERTADGVLAQLGARPIQTEEVPA